MNTGNWGGNVGSTMLSTTLQFEVVPAGTTTRLSAEVILRAGHRGPHAALLLAEAWNEDLARKNACMAVANGAKVHFAGSLDEMKIIRSDGSSAVLNPDGTMVTAVGGLSVWAS